MAKNKLVSDQDKVIVRLPDGMRDRLKAEADGNNRSMNAEIVARLEQSFRATLSISKGYEIALRKAAKVKLEEFNDELEDLLIAYFPEVGLDMLPEEHWRASMELYPRLPPDFREKWKEDVLRACRILAKDPNWMPPEDE